MTIKEVIKRSKNAIMPNIKNINTKYKNEDFSYTIRDMMNGMIKVRSYHGKKRGWSWSVFFIKHCIECSEPVFTVSSKVKGEHTALKGDSICDNLKCRESDTDWYLCTSPKDWAYGYIIALKRTIQKNGNLFRRKVFQHRWIIEKYLNRKLTKDEHVHHIDMSRINNKLSNLWVCNRKQHMIAHHSFNECCEKLMIKGDIKFNIEIGKYYLVN
jgi:hypothetical protein